MRDFIRIPKTDWIACADALPDWDKDRDHPGDTISRVMEVRNNDDFEFVREGFACFHFPTNEWSKRNASETWPVTHWRQV